jgi:hypothetical protein
MACLDFIPETAYEKPLSTSLYEFVIKGRAKGNIPVFRAKSTVLCRI